MENVLNCQISQMRGAYTSSASLESRERTQHCLDRLNANGTFRIHLHNSHEIPIWAWCTGQWAFKVSGRDTIKSQLVKKIRQSQLRFDLVQLNRILVNLFANNSGEIQPKLIETKTLKEIKCHVHFQTCIKCSLLLRHPASVQVTDSLEVFQFAKTK